MLKHYFLILARTLRRDKRTLFINLTGLSIGLACAMVIYLWVQDELSVDKFNEHDSRLYKVMSNYHNSDGISTTEGTPGILAEALASEIPEVEYATTSQYYDTKNLLTAGDNNIKAPGRYVGKDFFNIFSYQLIRGSKGEVLADKNSIVLSEDLAMKLFRTTENVVGRPVKFQKGKSLVVTGIFKGVPVNATDQFDFLLSFESFKDEHKWTLQWGNTGPQTYILLRKGVNIDQFNNKIRDFVKTKLPESSVTLLATPFSNNYLYGKYTNGVPSGGRIENVRLFSIIALFILAIACINFMNLSTAKASWRAREIGVKKVLGANKKVFIVQYLGESLMITFLALLIALGMVALLLHPFNEIAGKHLALNFNGEMILAFLCIAFITGILSGIYPAFYLSGFNPISSLNGIIKTSIGELLARKGLVLFQFAVSIILIAAVFITYKQIQFVQTRNLGYDRSNIIFFETEGEVTNNLSTFLSQVKQTPGIVNASAAGYEIGSVGCTYGLGWEGKDKKDATCFQQIAVDYDLIDLLGIKLKEGRTFFREFGMDSSNIIFNEAAIQAMGLKDPIGKTVKLWGKDVRIIGVVKNFYLESLHQDIQPLFFYLKPEDAWIVMIKLQAGKEEQALADLQHLYRSFNPGFELEYKFLNESYQAQYASETRISALSKYFAGLAIFVSCLGLFGLAAFTINRRRKEIGIRKILGAANFIIVWILTLEFTKVVLISILIALPLSYLLAKRWLDNFVLRIDLQVWYFLVAGLIALFIAWATIGAHAVKAANANPRDSLRDE